MKLPKPQKIVEIPLKYQTATQKNIVDESDSELISSIRVYVEKAMIKIDYRVATGAKLPIGKKGNRFRFSTAKKANSLNMKYVEKNSLTLVAEHYNSQFQSLENKDEPTLGDIAELALSEAESNRRKDDGTQDYRRILYADIAPIFWNMILSAIKVKDIKAWQTSIGTSRQISQSRFNKIFYVLKRILDYAMENDYISSNPISYVNRSSKLFQKQKRNDDNYFSKEQMRLILDDTCESCSAVDKAKHPFINTYMHVAFLTGARVGEIASLTWDNIDFNNNMITFATSIRKGVLDVIPIPIKNQN